MAAIDPERTFTPPFRRRHDTIRCTDESAHRSIRQNRYMDSRRFLPFAITFWTLFGLVVGIQVWISMIDHGHVVPWLLFYYLLVWVAWLGPTYAIVWLARRFPVEPPRPSNVAIHVLAATAIAVGHSAYEIGLMLWMRPYDRTTGALTRRREASRARTATAAPLPVQHTQRHFWPGAHEPQGTCGGDGGGAS